MYRTIRRYEAIDQSRADELVKKARTRPWCPAWTSCPASTAIASSTPATASLSSDRLLQTSAGTPTRPLASPTDWVREQKLDKALPNAPKITSGEAVVHTSELVTA